MKTHRFPPRAAAGLLTAILLAGVLGTWNAAAVSEGDSPIFVGRKLGQSPGYSAGRETSRWATGSALQDRLDSPVDILWAGNPLRHAIGNLLRSQRVAMLIDRRVDPDQKLDIRLKGVPLRSALQEVARSRGLGVSTLGPVLFLGPPEAASRLRTLSAMRAEDLQALPPAAAEKFARMKPMTWDDLTTPRELIAELARQNGVEVTGLELVPHDLWAAADLPPLPWADRLTLIAIQFDLTFTVSADGATVRLVPLPDRVAIVRSYPGGTNPAARARKYAALAPGAEVKLSAGRVYVRGLVEDQERITHPRRPAPHHREDRWTLKVADQPVGPLLEKLGQELNLKLKIDRKALDQAGVSLDQRISFRVSEVTADELLEAAAKPAGLRVVRRGNTIEVGPAKP